MKRLTPLDKLAFNMMPILLIVVPYVVALKAIITWVNP